MGWLGDLLSGKGLSKEAAATNREQEFERKVKANAWIAPLMDETDPETHCLNCQNETFKCTCMADKKKASSEETESCEHCGHLSSDHLDGRCYQCGCSAPLMQATGSVKKEAGAYVVGDDMAETIKKDYELGVSSLSNYNLAEMLANHILNVEGKGTMENFNEEKEKQLKSVNSDRKAAEAKMLKLMGEHTMVDWKKKFEEFKKEEIKSNDVKPEALYEPKLEDKKQNWEKKDDWKDMPSDKERVEGMEGVGREEKERTDVTAEGYDPKLGKEASLNKRAFLDPTVSEYDITARAYNRKTNKQIGEARTERINIKTNDLFNGGNSWPAVKTVGDIIEAYEAFWNTLNPNSAEIVLVDDVAPAESKEASQKQADHKHWFEQVKEDSTGYIFKCKTCPAIVTVPKDEEEPPSGHSEPEETCPGCHGEIKEGSCGHCGSKEASLHKQALTTWSPYMPEPLPGWKAVFRDGTTGTVVDSNDKFVDLQIDKKIAPSKFRKMHISDVQFERGDHPKGVYAVYAGDGFIWSDDWKLYDSGGMLISPKKEHEASQVKRAARAVTLTDKEIGYLLNWVEEGMDSDDDKEIAFAEKLWEKLNGKPMKWSSQDALSTINKQTQLLLVSKLIRPHRIEKNDLWVSADTMINGIMYHVEAKVYDEPSDYGINGGRVSKLLIYDRAVSGTESWLVNYDRGWDIGRNKKAVWQPIVNELEQFSKLYPDEPEHAPEITSKLSKTEILEKVSELNKRSEVESPWLVQKDATGQDVIVRREVTSKEDDKGLSTESKVMRDHPLPEAASIWGGMSNEERKRALRETGSNVDDWHQDLNEMGSGSQVDVLEDWIKRNK